MTTPRIYIVTEAKTGAETLVMAGTKAQAIRNVVDSNYSATAAKPLDIARLMSAGAKLHEANTDEENENV